MSRYLDWDTKRVAEDVTLRLLNQVTIDDVREMLPLTQTPNTNEEEVFAAVRKARVEFPEKI